METKEGFFFFFFFFLHKAVVLRLRGTRGGKSIHVLYVCKSMETSVKKVMKVNILK